MVLMLFSYITCTYPIEGRPMFYLGISLFEKHNLMTILHLESSKVMRFLGEVKIMMLVCLFMCMLCCYSIG